MRRRLRDSVHLAVDRHAGAELAAKLLPQEERSAGGDRDDTGCESDRVGVRREEKKWLPRLDQ